LNVWLEFTKKRDGTERVVMIGLVFALVGVVVGLWAFVVTGDSPSTLALTFIVVGLLISGVAAIVGARSKPR
jgi:VIT1/CCC1 family predicted Fe2+/Mn2+ transporter